MSANLLLIEDDDAMREMLVDSLVAAGMQVSDFSGAKDALAALADIDFDVVLTDVKLKGESGLELCQQIVARRPELPVVVVTAFGSMDTAVAAIRAGAYDFIQKPIDLASLKLTLARAADHHQLRREVRRLRQASAEQPAFDEVVGESRAMERVYDLLGRLRDSDAAILIRGESGTGKELVARALHRGSRFSEGPFVPINCAAMPETLLESTLFGHVKGAFTDAQHARGGLFLEANGGTLFLDEIGEMPASMQSKLLRVVQERKVRPVGGSELIPFDTRVVSATNRDLESEIEQGRFREDLYYRVAVVTVEVPPLRARGNDVLKLAHFFLERAARRAGKSVTGISSEAARKLRDYDWPGNVRQLQNVMERALALTRFDQITVDDLPKRVLAYESERLVIVDDDPEHMLTLEQVEERYLKRVLKICGGNKTQAASVLGVDRRTLYRKLERYEQGPHAEGSDGGKPQADNGMAAVGHEPG